MPEVRSRFEVAEQGDQGEDACMLWEDQARVVEKEKFVMPKTQSATPPAPSVVNVSSSPQNLYTMLLSELGKKINDAQLST